MFVKQTGYISILRECGLIHC